MSHKVLQHNFKFVPGDFVCLKNSIPAAPLWDFFSWHCPPTEEVKIVGWLRDIETAIIVSHDGKEGWVLISSQEKLGWVWSANLELISRNINE